MENHMNRNYINSLFEQMVEHCLTDPFLAPLTDESCPWTVSMLAEGVRATILCRGMELDDGYNPSLTYDLRKITEVDYYTIADPTEEDRTRMYMFSVVCELIYDKIMG